MGVENTLEDKRGRRWEIFMDESYYHQWCVRPVDMRSFGSPMSFHFIYESEARDFFQLIGKSS